MNWREELFSRRTLGVRLGLESVAAVDRELGSPGGRHVVVHVVGTNGKGSTAAMVDHGLRASAGRRVGLFTSPHLRRVGERVRIDGVAVSDEQIERATLDVLAAERSARVTLSFFEILTMAALQIFEAARVELIVLEAGLGGRLDATRLRISALTLVTSIGLDHQRFLGDTLVEIAADKAAAIHRGAPCFAQRPADAAVEEVISQRALEVGTRLEWVPPLDVLPQGLSGDFQRHNAALALKALRHLVPTARKGHLAGVHWPGRWERRRIGECEVVFDVAHNADAIRALDPDLRAFRPTHIVFGCMPDKDVQGMIDRLIEHAEHGWVVTPPASPGPPLNPRLPTGWECVTGIGDPGFAPTWKRLLAHANRVVVCGSHSLVGALRMWIGAEEEYQPLPVDPTDPR
ncbi:MAG: hypothetical protein V3V08_02235 [Nannocystaceae bacterium]